MTQELRKTSEVDVVGRVGRTVLTTGAIAEIAALAARTVPGVVDLDGRPDVPVGPTEVQDGRTEVRLAVVAAYDVPLRDLAAEVRHAVAGTVTEMTGLDVVSVDVAVNDVTLPTEPARASPGTR